jgi:hypothetical protein
VGEPIAIAFLLSLIRVRDPAPRCLARVVSGVAVAAESGAAPV